MAEWIMAGAIIFSVYAVGVGTGYWIGRSRYD